MTNRSTAPTRLVREEYGVMLSELFVTDRTLRKRQRIVQPTNQFDIYKLCMYLNLRYAEFNKVLKMSDSNVLSDKRSSLMNKLLIRSLTVNVGFLFPQLQKQCLTTSNFQNQFIITLLKTFPCSVLFNDPFGFKEIHFFRFAPTQLHEIQIDTNSALEIR